MERPCYLYIFYRGPCIPLVTDVHTRFRTKECVSTKSFVCV